MKNLMRPLFGCLFVLCLGLPCAGCGESPATAAPAASERATPQAPLIEQATLADWCGEHGVPESICTRCNAALIPAFQAQGDWCEQHALPESQCLACHPELEAKLAEQAPESGG